MSKIEKRKSSSVFESMFSQDFFDVFESMEKRMGEHRKMMDSLMKNFEKQREDSVITSIEVTDNGLDLKLDISQFEDKPRVGVRENKLMVVGKLKEESPNSVSVEQIHDSRNKIKDRSVITEIKDNVMTVKVGLDPLSVQRESVNAEFLEDSILKVQLRPVEAEKAVDQDTQDLLSDEEEVFLSSN